MRLWSLSFFLSCGGRGKATPVRRGRKCEGLENEPLSKASWGMVALTLALWRAEPFGLAGKKGGKGGS